MNRTNTLINIKRFVDNIFRNERKFQTQIRDGKLEMQSIINGINRFGTITFNTHHINGRQYHTLYLRVIIRPQDFEINPRERVENITFTYDEFGNRVK